MSDMFKIVNEDAQSGVEMSGSQTLSEPESSTRNDSAFPDEDEETITMLDVLEREDKLEEEATALLGNSDEKNCTYSKGYMPRQALYSCATCFDATKTPAAICLACSLECHEDHEVHELYTKRFFRCDCGNSKFKPKFECKLMEKNVKKLPVNEKNSYNHNFNGKYCVCDKRYPPDENDESDSSQDDMWQCIVCEDWFHTKHLNAKNVPSTFEEMICGTCVCKLDFVHQYKALDSQAPASEISPQLLTTTIARNTLPSCATEDNSVISNPSELAKEVIDKRDNDKNAQESGPSSVVETNQAEAENTNDMRKSTDSAVSVTSAATATSTSKLAPASESDTNDSQLENKDPILTEKLQSSASSGCILDDLKAQSKAECNSATCGPVFWQQCDWRNKLCKCSKCLEMYKTKECEYLLDSGDTIQNYEALGKAKAKIDSSKSEQGLMTALGRMNRVAAIEAIHGYNALKADLSDYLRKFADCKKVVREADIHEFFEQMRAKKRPRLE